MINLIFRKWLIHTTCYFRGLLNHMSWISAVFRIYMLFFNTIYQRMFEGLFFYISILFNLAVFKYVAYTSRMLGTVTKCLIPAPIDHNCLSPVLMWLFLQDLIDTCWNYKAHPKIKDSDFPVLLWGSIAVRNYAPI